MATSAVIILVVEAGRSVWSAFFSFITTAESRSTAVSPWAESTGNPSVLPKTGRRLKAATGFGWLTTTKSGLDKARAELAIKTNESMDSKRSFMVLISSRHEAEKSLLLHLVNQEFS